MRLPVLATLVLATSLLAMSVLVASESEAVAEDRGIPPGKGWFCYGIIHSDDGKVGENQFCERTVGACKERTAVLKEIERKYPDTMTIRDCFSVKKAWVFTYFHRLYDAYMFRAFTELRDCKLNLKNHKKSENLKRVSRCTLRP